MGLVLDANVLIFFLWKYKVWTFMVMNVKSLDFFGLFFWLDIKVLFSYFWRIWKFKSFICWIFLKYFLIVDTKNWISFISMFIQNLNFTFLRDTWTIKIESKIEVEWWRKLNIQYLHAKKLASNSVDMKKIKKWEWNQGEHAEKDMRGPKQWLSDIDQKANVKKTNKK
jgi:hypothetical protein